MTVEVDLSGIARMAEYFEEAPRIARQAASMAINQTADRVGVRQSRTAMLRQTAFPAGYLNDPERFGLRKSANPADLEAIVSGRTRPTSLARFAQWGAAREGATVTVNPGAPKRIGRAFRVRLKNGNVGLAIRLREGEQVQNRKYPATIFQSGIALLYGPSVDQVFQDVRYEVAPIALDSLRDEFLRQYVRLSRT